MSLPLTKEELTGLLAAAFAGAQVDVVDNSAQHAGHAGNMSGGGHYKIKLVWDGFAGMNRLARERRVHEALAEPMRAGRIHALRLTLRTLIEAA